MFDRHMTIDDSPWRSSEGRGLDVRIPYAGQYTIEQATRLRISYLPAPLRRQDRTTLAAA